jgi:hypothetical protein
MRKLMTLVLFSIFLYSAVAAADANNVDVGLSIDAGGQASLDTSALDKGFFTRKNVIDRKKTDIITLVTVDGALERFSSSAGAGNLKGVLSGGGKVNGFTYDLNFDLQSHANTWRNFKKCNGNSIVVGSKQAKEVVAKVLVIDPQTLDARTDASGVALTGYASAILSAQQLDDEEEAECFSGPAGESDGCVGQCVSAAAKAGKAGPGVACDCRASCGKSTNGCD